MGNKNLWKFFGVSFFLAKKNIYKNKKTAVLILIIISLGFISSITFPGILRDVTYDLEENFIGISVGHIIIEPLEKDEKIEGVNGIIKKIKILPNIVGVASIQKKTARLFDSKNNFIDGEVWIVNPDDFGKVSLVNNLVYGGDFLNKGGQNKIFTGCSNIKSCSTAKGIDNLDVDVGGKIDVFFNEVNKTFQLTLQGFYKRGFEQVEHLILINEKTAEDIFPDYNRNEADLIMVRILDREFTDSVLFSISSLGIKAKIVDWKYKLAFQSDTVESFGIIGTFAFFLGVLISLISVYIILFINILNKKVQIGIVKAVGVDSKIISMSYILQALFYGILGSIFGILFTYIMILYFTMNPIKTAIGDLVPKVILTDYLFVSVSVIFSSIVAGYLVSRKIIKQNILDSIF